MYGVVARRRGTIIDERLREGTNVFTIHATMPVAESFGFADELRKKTQGVASPQLVFSHWALMQQDPFFVPTTEDELAEFGAVRSRMKRQAMMHSILFNDTDTDTAARA